MFNYLDCIYKFINKHFHNSIKINYYDYERKIYQKYTNNIIRYNIINDNSYKILKIIYHKVILFYDVLLNILIY